MKIKTTLYLFILFGILTNLTAEVTDHFKPCPDKGEDHQIRNIDFIYMINLDQRPEKYKNSLDRLLPYGIHPYRFSAVNGWELSLEALDDIGLKYLPWMASDIMGTCYPVDGGGAHFHEMINVVGKTYFCHCMPRGSIGIVLSHLSILQDAYDAGYETIWVMEDDIEVIRDPRILSDMIDRLDALVGKDGWDFLFTDQDTKNNAGQYVPSYGHARRPNLDPGDSGRFEQRYDISNEFRRIGSRYGAYSMIIRRNGMREMLDYLKNYKIFLPYDMDYQMPTGIRMYTVIDDVVSTQINALSDNGAPYYKDKIE